uniref:TonB-dependent receptor plug domain-containing protein n=1 Tax=Phenylobacterium sp. TaxID=1871053 RepID=UPI00398386AE
MTKISFFGSASVIAATLALGAAGSAAAQATQATTQQSTAEVTEVVVTGSFIRGTPEDAALPVDVVSSEELQRRGSPTTIDLIKSLPVSGPVLGDTNQFSTAAQGQVGAGTINLRGLGSLRTLVLQNGRRTVASAGAGSGGVDTNLLPVAAIGRVEVLKDGAAATYGSDAIAGVVNFITRKNFSGLEVSADYRLVDGSNGDYSGSVAYGWVGDNANLLITAGYQHRSELSTTERDWAIQPYLTNPSGYSVLGQPPSFLPRNGLTPTAGVQRDANCGAVGGFPGFSGATPACYFTYIPFDNLVEDEERYQIYGEVNVDLTEKTRFHVEAHYAKTDIPHIRFSPAFPPIQGPNGPGSVGVFTVPTTNPGALTALQQAGLSPAQIAATNNISLTLFRALGAGGNPAYGDGGQIG